MIQRIQSIWFLLAGITISCLIFTPIITTTAGNIEYYVIAKGLYQKTGDVSTLVKSSTPLLIMTIATAVMCFVSIFNYSDRTRQKRIAFITIVFILGLSFWCSNFSKQIPGGIESATLGIGLFLPVIAISFVLLGIRGIKSDERLLKSADRLR